MKDYKLSKQIKRFSLILIILGAIGIAFGFYSAPSNIDDVQLKDLGIKIDKKKS